MPLPSLPENRLYFCPFITLYIAPPSRYTHEINSKQLAVFGGYKNGHLDSVEVFEDDTWMYTGRRLEEPKSKMAMVSLPEGLIRQNC